MFPFWDLAVEPVLAAAGARRVVEVGALRGETTVRMLDVLGPESEVHVIDPVPVFDPEEHEKQFPGRYLFHRDLSHHVLPDLPAMDAALIDGDHNWYTVYHELHMLSDVARKADKPLPLMVLHDVGWPYGRRDLYYAPDQIPDEFRQPHAQGGMHPGVSELDMDGGGLNPTMWNAVTEGGPRNGVMTAVDDFIAEYDRPLRLLVLPVYFGLAIVVERATVEQHPELREVLDRLESVDGQADLARLAEEVRLEATILQHRVFFTAEQRTLASARRYLDILEGALLNEHYIEQELRIHQLARTVQTGSDPYAESLRDPTRRLLGETRMLRERRRAGRQPGDDDVRHYFPLTAIGRVRLDALEANLETIREESVVGDLVECGTGRGGVGVLLRGFLDAHAMPFQRVFVAGEFRAAPAGETTNAMGVPDDSGAPGGPGFPQLAADLNGVRDAFDRFGLLDSRVRFLQGPYEETLPSAPTEKIALLHLGETVTADAGRILDELYDRVSLGGFVVIDQYADPATRAAVDEFRDRRGVDEPFERVDWSASGWRKTRVPIETTALGEPQVQVQAAAPVPLQRPMWVGRCDLTVVVVFYNMKREAARTLHSLSRAYQEGIDDLDYEVVVVDNGSDKDQKLGEELVKSFGPEFRYIGLGKKAGPSPVAALNRGMIAGRGDAFALMIDGAHVLTPGVLRFGMAGLRTYAPAVVATQQWYVGPGEQGEAITQGYDQDFEDVLFDRIGWPAAGYRLFDIGHFIGERDWLDGMWESNCLFVPRALLDQAGCFDERFSMPGGGFANLEFYERMTQSPDVTLVSILGEGSFHQVHGGTTTNVADGDDRKDLVSGYGDHFEELRGRRFFGYNKELHFIGTMKPEAARTRARRRVVPNLLAAGPGGDGIPSRPTPMPRDLRAAFTESYWDSLAWDATTWLGHDVDVPPADLLALQALVSRVRPDWIVETGTGNGGRALFLATVCELLGHGRVLCVDPDGDAGRPAHPRLEQIVAEPRKQKTFDRVRERVGSPANALVILGSRGTAGQTSAEFNLYEPLVPPGSYVVIADTVVNGHPVWPEYGPGPYEAVKGVVETRDDFVTDRDLDAFTPSFSPGGYLKRLR